MFEWIEVFNYSDKSPPLFPLIFLVPVVLIISLRKYLASVTNRFLQLLLGAVCIVFIGFVVTTQAYHISCNSMLNSDQLQIAEGEVHTFQARPGGGPGVESFSIGDQHFSYSPSLHTSDICYDIPQGQGGVIEEGNIYRISHVGNAILKVEKYGGTSERH